jgi:multidrug resistance efflux pump
MLEPIKKVVVSSQVSGVIVKLYKNKELSVASGKVVSIDDRLDVIKLKNLEQKLKYLEEQIQIKQRNYKSIANISAKSRIQKDAQKLELLSFKSSKEDLVSSIETLKDQIAKKNIKLNNMYIKSFLVEQGEFVGMGTRLLEAEDHSASKLTIYVNEEDLKNIQNKTIFINGNSNHNFKLNKVANSTDSTYISSYKVELVKSGTSGRYGEVLSVEFR